MNIIVIPNNKIIKLTTMKTEFDVSITNLGLLNIHGYPCPNTYKLMEVIKGCMSNYIANKSRDDIVVQTCRDTYKLMSYEIEGWNLQLQDLKKKVKNNEIYIKLSDNREPFIQGKQFYTFVVRWSNDSMPNDILGMAFDDYVFIRKGVIFAFKKRENRDMSYKYIMGKKLCAKHEIQLQKDIREVADTTDFLDAMYEVINSSDSVKLTDIKYFIRKNHPDMIPITPDDIINKSIKLYHLIKVLKRLNILRVFNIIPPPLQRVSKI